MTTVSVVLATYQGERFLELQLDSILEGTRPPDEVVIVDDASRDGTVPILDRYSNGPLGDRIKVIRRQQNQGPSLSFAEGIGHTSGDLVFLADQDDRWATDKICKVEAAFRDQPATVMVYHDGTICDTDLAPDGRTIFNTRKRAELELGSKRDPMELCGNPDVKGCTMALEGDFARRLFKRTAPEFASYWGHDHWAALFALATGNVIVLPEVLIEHRFHARNTSSAVGFDPFSMRHWLRNFRTAQAQQADHFVQRYRIALEHMTSEGPIKDALSKHLELASMRYELRSKGLLERLGSVVSSYRKGIYHEHYNGIPTALRDLFS